MKRGKTRKVLEAVGILPMLASPVVFWFEPLVAIILFLAGLPFFLAARLWKWWASDD